MTQTKIQEKFYPLTVSITEVLRKAKLTAAEWRIWSYLVELDPFGDRYEDFDYLRVMSICECSKTTMWRAFAKFQEFKIFDFQSRGLCLKNLIGTSQLRKPESQSETDKPNSDRPKPRKRPETNQRPETPETSARPEPVSEMKSEFQNCNNDFKNEISVSKMKSEFQNCKNQGSKRPSDIESASPQTLQTYSDFRRSLSESARENFFSYVKEKTKHLSQPINDLEAWLASKNAANQNRWSAYYKLYQEEELRRKTRTKNKNFSTKQLTLEETKRAIANFKNRHNRSQRNEKFKHRSNSETNQ